MLRRLILCAFATHKSGVLMYSALFLWSSPFYCSGLFVCLHDFLVPAYSFNAAIFGISPPCKWTHQGLLPLVKPESQYVSINLTVESAAKSRLMFTNHKISNLPQEKNNPQCPWPLCSPKYWSSNSPIWLTFQLLQVDLKTCFDHIFPLSSTGGLSPII